ncbi:hypothetical protein MAPG_02000 [Magnaporthiopsis poae ATCC 64411]|uniref:Uncharacterized protein n=1 Tax=Magnaporthiopsis poae (strain ATCC 64411 / 73-15) TaxID=644358 RepID=A0A0C4DQ62_MAGP6|nr:hypothetical protein MAPG_02000 [Magnaporthiopsis poae ATCC 64411]
MSLLRVLGVRASAGAWGAAWFRPKTGWAHRHGAGADVEFPLSDNLRFNSSHGCNADWEVPSHDMGSHFQNTDTSRQTMNVGRLSDPFLAFFLDLDCGKQRSIPGNAAAMDAAGGGDAATGAKSRYGCIGEMGHQRDVTSVDPEHHAQHGAAQDKLENRLRLPVASRRSD